MSSEIESNRIDNPGHAADSSTQWKEYFGLFTALMIIFVLTSITTYVVGANWDRWGHFSKKMKVAGKALEEIPRQFGDWEASGEDEKLDQASMEQLELSDYIVRRFVNKLTQEKVSLIVMVGPTGRLVVHTPIICFGGRNFKMDSNPIPVAFPIPDAKDNEKDVFRKIVFRNQSIAGGAKIFYYGISVGNEWNEITGSSRSDYQHYRFLYKMQLEAFVPDENIGENDVIKRFLGDLLPHLRGKLVECS